MNPITSKYLPAGAALLIIFVFGFWLSRTGKRYNTILLTVHKLVGFGLGVYIVIMAARINKVTPLNSTGLISSLMTAAIFLALVVTGGLISAEINVPEAVSGIHKILPYLALLSTGATFYFLF